MTPLVPLHREAILVLKACRRRRGIGSSTRRAIAWSMGLERQAMPPDSYVMSVYVRDPFRRLHHYYHSTMFSVRVLQQATCAEAYARAIAEDLRHELAKMLRIARTYGFTGLARYCDDPEEFEALKKGTRPAR